MKSTRKPNPSGPDADNPEWTRKDMASARAAAEVLSGLIGAKAAEELVRRGRGRRPKATRKVNQTLRLDPDVLAATSRSVVVGRRSSIRCCVNTCPVTEVKPANFGGVSFR